VQFVDGMLLGALIAAIIADGRVAVHMARQLLHDSKVGARVEQVANKPAAQVVTGEMGDSDFHASPLHHLSVRCIREPSAEEKATFVDGCE
jgi:hypothetical protein